MLAPLTAALLPVALGQTFIPHIGDPVISAEEFGCDPLDDCEAVSAGWPRTLWYEDVTGTCPPLPEWASDRAQQNLDTDCTGWKLMYARLGAFRMIHLADPSDVKEIKDSLFHNMVSTAGLRDHAFVRCAKSGNYLHIASAGVDTPNDSAYAFRYDRDLQPLSNSAIEEGVSERSHNGMPVACAPPGHNTVFGASAADVSEPEDIHVRSRFFGLDSDGATTRTDDLVDLPRTAGCTFHWDPETRRLLVWELALSHR